MFDKLTIRELREEDMEQTLELDNLSDFRVEGWVDSGCSFGLFADHNLIGYLTLGFADFCGDVIDNHHAKDNDSLMLSNVFIKKEYRGDSLGLKFINRVINDYSESIYLSILDERLLYYYEKLGFVDIGDYCMYRKEKTKMIA